MGSRGCEINGAVLGSIVCFAALCMKDEVPLRPCRCYVCVPCVVRQAWISRVSQSGAEEHCVRVVSPRSVNGRSQSVSQSALPTTFILFY